MTAILIGAGFVGSVFTTEFAKLAYAGKLGVQLAVVDDDTVSDRNCANQQFSLHDIGEAKAVVVRDAWRAMGLVGEAYRMRLTPETREPLFARIAEDGLDTPSLLISAVDNLATRQFIWAMGNGLSLPVLHLGLSELGTGRVEWTTPDADHYALAPQHTAGKEIKDPVSGVTPPCELVRMRSTGWNASYAAAKAAAIYYGFDPTGVTPTPKECAGWATAWVANPEGHRQVAELHHQTILPPLLAEAA